jgi:hypothetical protein
LRLWLIGLIFSTSLFAKQSFQIVIEKNYMQITAPSRSEWSQAKLSDEENSTISVTFINKTQTHFHSLLKTQVAVLRRFTIKPESQRSFEIEYSDDYEYFYTPMSPAGQTIKLAFTGKSYEVPAQK